MEQVSSFLENILVVEPDKAEKIERLPEAAKSLTKPLTKSLTKPLTAETATDNEPAADQAEQLPNPSLYSGFWYLEDDPRKASNQLTEKLMEKVLNVIINSETEASSGLEARMAVHRTRPPFSVNLMSTNSTHLAQKTSPVFETIDAIILFFCWYNPAYTIGVLMLVTHVILNPYLGTALPPALLIKRFIVPSYLRLYPPDTSVIDGELWARNPEPYQGPPLKKYEPPKPCSQFSREFLMNFADLQNQMVCYIRLYDQLVAWGQHYFLFENYKLTCVVFAILVFIIVFELAVLPNIMPYILLYFPWKTFSIILVWLFVAAFHPKVKDTLLDYWHSEDARLARLDSTDRVETFLTSFVAEEIKSDILRQVEIFELHRLSSRNIWEPMGFATDYYTLNHPQRIMELLERKKDVKPKEKKRRWSSEKKDKKKKDKKEKKEETREERGKTEVNDFSDKAGAPDNQSSAVDSTRDTKQNVSTGDSGSIKEGASIGDTSSVEASIKDDVPQLSIVKETRNASEAAIVLPDKEMTPGIISESELEEAQIQEHIDSAKESTKENEEDTLPIPLRASLGEIRLPPHWQFSEDSWSIDLEPHIWVDQNCIMDLVNVDADEKWVYDFADNGDTPDGHVFRRRRWVRACKREKIVATVPTPATSSRSSEWLSKTLSLT